MRLSEDYIRAIHDANDIISVAQSYVELKRAGSTYACRCPFHSEKTPSCHFYESTQSFYCFGCGAGGDVITFIRLIENLDYMDAVRFLAQRGGLPMPDERDSAETARRRRLYEMNREAGKFFHRQLFSPEGAVGLDYLRRRGLSDHTIKRFGLGFAADDWHKLHYYMKNLGYNDFELAEGSLIVNRNNSFYDKFRNRVMFPIFDTRGNVAAFGGRTLSEDKQTAKYLNSAETPIYHKSDMLFALNIAKNSKADYFIVCEGYMDVISMHQAGFDSAIASLGTALTEHQCNIISRLGKKEVVLSYDSDEAGQKATARAINLMNDVGMRTRVLKIDGAKDPDEFIKKYGAEAFQSIINKAGGSLEYRLDKLSEGLSLENGDDASEYLKRAVKFLAEVPSPIDREVFISKIARRTEVSASTLKTAVDEEIRHNNYYNHKKEQRELTHIPEDKINPESRKMPKAERAERGILCFLFHNPDCATELSKSLPNGLITEFDKRVYIKMLDMIKNGQKPDISAFNEEFSTAEMGRITQITSDSSFAYDKDAVKEYIEVINEKFSSMAEKSVSEMTPQELENWLEKQRERKK